MATSRDEEKVKAPSPALLARVIDGDRTAQGTLLGEHHDFIRRMLFRLVGPSADLDDLQQTVMMRMLQSLHRFRATSAFRTWVGSLCVHVARDALRRQHTRGEAVQPEDVGLRDADDPHATIAARQQLACCRRALGALSTEQRIAFVLKVLDGHSVEEVAVLMNAAKSTTRMRLYWGRKVFARALAAEGVELPASMTEEEA